VEEFKTTEFGDFAFGVQKPAFVLISSVTFSGGEELAYDLQAPKTEVTGVRRLPAASTVPVRPATVLDLSSIEESSRWCMAGEESTRETIVVRSPSTEEEWRQADLLLSELKEWDARQSQALGFDPDEVMKIFYPDSIADTKHENLTPAGCLLLAINGRTPVAVAAYRKLTPDTCELYNVYARPACRGRGIGLQLLHALMSNAKSAGYSTMYLETAMFMRDAHRLYGALNFRVRKAYRIVPAKFAAATMWMECCL
jgi:GNAT superfamily N-acetyltransferase